MQTVVLADTHLHMPEHPLEKIISALSAVDLIIHAADFTYVKLLEELKRLREVKSV